jgi:hypothetical protein
MDSIYPLSTPEIARKRRDLAPNQQAAFDAFGNAVFADGALQPFALRARPAKAKSESSEITILPAAFGLALQRRMAAHSF